jgi:transposase
VVVKGNEFLWKEVQRLWEEKRVLREELGHRADQAARVAELEKRCLGLEKENARLVRRVNQLTEKLAEKPKAPPPPFVKPNVPGKQRKRPGRKAGHPAALRPKPRKIDEHRMVDLGVDAGGKPCCPACHTQLADLRHFKRLVEEIIPARPFTICYHTTSGYCPCCRKRIESRAPEQPPAADIPHAQLGLNALSTAAVLRVCYRLPLRQISKLFAQLPGISLSPGGIVKQLQRLSKWLLSQYHRLKLLIRAAGVVYADETGWRTNGRSTQLWTLNTDHHTLYHVDKSRGGKVIAELLGEAFGAGGASTLVSDFYSVYDQFDCPQQKCLAHLLRELSDTMNQRPELARGRAKPSSGHAFFKRCKRLVKDMLRLKARRKQLSNKRYQHQVQLVEKRLAKLGQQTWNDDDADRIARRLRKHNGKLTTFLHKPEVNGTNNAAERALRPAVVMRKITGGSRSEKGAKAWAILASVMRTAEQQGRDLVETIQTLLKAEWAGKNIGLLSDVLTRAEP